MKFTDSVRSRQVPDTPFTSAWPPRMPSVPTSRATRVTSSANDDSWSTMVFTVPFSSAISPFTSTVTFCDRSPSATAVVTCAMLRTWLVRFEAIRFTESVRSFQVPATFGTAAWPPSLPSVPTSRATRVTSSANDESWSTMVLVVIFSSRISPFTSTVMRCVRSPHGHRRHHLGDVAHLAREVGGHAVHGVGEVLPGARDVRHRGLAAELAVGAHLARDARDLLGEDRERVGHLIHRVGQLGNLALGLDGDLLGEVAAGDRLRHLRDVADLTREVRRHAIHRLGEVAPGAGDALDLGLTAQLALGTHL